MLLTIRKSILPLLFLLPFNSIAQVKIDSTRIHYTYTDHYEPSDCFYESADYIVPVISHHDHTIGQKLNDSIISLFRGYWEFENYSLDSVVNSGGSHDLSPAQTESDSVFECDFRSSSITSNDLNTLSNARTFLSLNLSFYTENTAASVSTDHTIHPLLFDLKRKCWINKDSLFLHSIDTIIEAARDSFQQEDGERTYFEGIGIADKKIIFYYQRNWPNHSFTEEIEFNPSSLSSYIRQPYRKLLKSLE